MTSRRRLLTETLGLRARDCADLPQLAAAVCDAFGAHIDYCFGCLATIDPSTGLISWAWKTHPLEVGDEEFAAAEYGGPDVNLFSEIAGRPEPVGVLSVDTGGAVDSCRRLREFMRPRFGFTDELRVVFRSRGLTWAALALYRGIGEPAFTAQDGEVAVSAHVRVAELVQDVLFSSQQAPPAIAPGPAVIVVDSNDRITNLTPAARTRVDELGGWNHGSLPDVVLAAVAAARNTPALATTRAVGRSGAWLSVRATTFASPDLADGGPAGDDVVVTADVVVTVDVASPADISSLRLAARGLSRREQEVAALVLQGAPTTVMARSLFMSPHTVQDHLKSIFGKLGVNSRREMVRQLVLG